MTAPSPNRPAAMRVAPCAPETATAADVLPQLPPAVSAAGGLFGGRPGRGRPPFRWTKEGDAFLYGCQGRLTQGEAALELRISIWSVKTRCRIIGLRWHPISKPHRIDWSGLDEPMHAMRVMKLSRKVMAGRLGVSEGALWKRLRDLNVPLWAESGLP